MTPIMLSGTWALIYQILVILSWVGSLIFPLWYGLTMPWFRSDMGRHLFAYSAWSAVTMTLVAVRPLFGDGPPTVSAIGLVLVCALGFLGWWRAWLFYKHR
jgi:hypothetical protein